MNWFLLEMLAGIAALAVIAFYLRRLSHYSDALERQVSELRQQIEVEQRAGHQDIQKLREDVESLAQPSAIEQLQRLESGTSAAIEELGRRFDRLVADIHAGMLEASRPKETAVEPPAIPALRQSPQDISTIATETGGAAPLHPVFGRFRRYNGPGRPGFIGYDFLCSFVREDYAGVKTRDVAWLATGYPPAHEDLFAWIDLLEAVVAARKKFRMFELGAGYGCWSARGALAAMQLGLDVELTCIEPEPQHFQWIEQHMLANSIPASSVRMIHAALAGKPGRMPFLVDSPYPEHRNANHWYGQAVAQTGDVVVGSGGAYHGFSLLTMKSGYKAVEVPAVTLEEVLHGQEVVDFIHADLQNAELDVFSAGIDLVDRLVRRINIGTHSIASEEGLRDLFRARGWECLNDYSLGGPRQTPYGTIEFQDGVQSWRNPKLAFGES